MKNLYVITNSFKILF